MITTDIFRKLPYDFYEDLLRIIENVWTPPREWRSTTLTPIPEKCKPQSVNQFRRITLINMLDLQSCFLYNVEAFRRYMIPELGEYQAAFFHNRSALSHIFNLPRVLKD